MLKAHCNFGDDDVKRQETLFRGFSSTTATCLPSGKCMGMKWSVQRKKRYVFFSIHAVLPIFMGAAIYSLWRSKTLLVFAWYRWIGLEGQVSALRTHTAAFRHFIPGPILYSLPDALWVYSFAAVMQYVWFQQPNRYGRIFWILLAVALGVGGEIGQLFKVVPGRFDPMDLIGYIAAWLLASIVTQSFMKSVGLSN